MALWEARLAAQRVATIWGAAQVIAKSRATGQWTYFDAKPGFRRESDKWFSAYEVVFPNVR